MSEIHNPDPVALAETVDRWSHPARTAAARARGNWATCGLCPRWWRRCAIASATISPPAAIEALGASGQPRRGGESGRG